MRTMLFLAFCVALGALGWNAISAQERAMLHVSGAREGYYARVWVVDAKPYAWIRAESPTRQWLEPLRQYPDVILWRGGQRYAFHAEIWEDDETVAWVDSLFREKYGTVDWLRSWLRHDRSVPIRLDPR